MTNIATRFQPDISGSAVPSGFVGEVVYFTLSTSTNLPSATTTFGNLLTLNSSNLSKGVWLLNGIITLQANGASGFSPFYVCVSDYSGNDQTDHIYPTQTLIPVPVFFDGTGLGIITNAVVYMSGSNSKYIKARCDYSSGTPQYRYGLRAIRIA